MRSAPFTSRKMLWFKAIARSQPISFLFTSRWAVDGSTWSLPRSQWYKKFLAQNSCLSSYMDTFPTFFEVLTLLSAIAWRHQPATDPEETSPLKMPTALSVGSGESKALAKGRNLRFCQKGFWFSQEETMNQITQLLISHGGL